MKIINRHIVEDDFGLFFCDEFFDNEIAIETESFEGLCAKCCNKYKKQMTIAAKYLNSLHYSNTMYFNKGNPYIIDLHTNKKHNISHKSLDFLEKQGFIMGWRQGEFRNNDIVDCKLTSKGREYIKKHRRI